MCLGSSVTISLVPYKNNLKVLYHWSFPKTYPRGAKGKPEIVLSSVSKFLTQILLAVVSKQVLFIFSRPKLRISQQNTECFCCIWHFNRFIIRFESFMALGLLQSKERIYRPNEILRKFTNTRSSQMTYPRVHARPSIHSTRRWSVRHQAS